MFLAIAEVNFSVWIRFKVYAFRAGCYAGLFFVRITMQNRPMKLLLCVLLAALSYLQYRLWFGEGSLANLHRLQQAIDAQSMDNAQLRERNQLLSAKVFALKEGSDAIEERARVDLGMIKKGETFFMVVPPGSEKANSR